MKNQKKLFLTYFVMICALILTTISTAQAATFTVNVDTDQKDLVPGDGMCAAAYRTCTLRAAIEEANALAGSDYINFSNSFKAPNAPKTIVLTLGQLLINSDMTINGPGARQLAVDGNQKSRVFLLSSVQKIVGISGLTIQNGFHNVPFVSCASGICNQGGSLLLSRVAVRNNDTVGDDPAHGEEGGGVANYGFINIENSTISHNTGGYGGGVYNEGTLYMYNSTIAYNTSEAIGSGGVSQNGEAQIRNSTITNNVSMNEEGGGIRNKGVLFLGNTIVANNNAPLNKDISGTINSYGNNLVRTRGGSVGYVASDLPDGTSANLGALQNNGGETDTRALMSNSPAIDAGNDCITVPGCSGEFYYDQRGVGFPRKIGSAVDIGAFEFQGRNSGVVQISGKVLKPNGRGLNNAVVTLTGSDDTQLSVETDQHGNFSFDNVMPDRSYVIAAESRQYNYASQNIFVTEARDDVNFVPVEGREPVDAPR